MTAGKAGTELSELNIAVIGVGTMGGVIVESLIEKELAPADRVAAAEPDRRRREQVESRYGIAVYADNRKALEGADLVVLAVKPQVIAEVLSEIKGDLSEEQLIFSVAAGVTTRRIEALLEGPVRVVRIMPNTPCQIGSGACAVACGRHAGPEEAELALRFFSSLGRAVRVDEELMDAVTGLSGSGPAYIYQAIEALADGAVFSGLDRGTALQLAAQTVKGAAEMVLETGRHPGELKDMVTSPGGTTIAGVRELERSGLRSALIEAVVSAASRSRELGGDG